MAPFHRLSSWPPKTTLKTTLTTLLTTLLPSPTHHLIHPSLDSSPPPSHQQTAYLDGIRGLAALTVYIQHYSAPFQEGIIGDANRASGSWSIFQYPVIRLFYSGSFAVALFFVISGFALSRKPLCLRYSASEERGGSLAALECLSSATFRRAVRIYLPPIAVVLFTMLATWAGSFDSALAILPSYLTDKYNVAPPPKLASFPAQLLDCLVYIAAHLIYPAQWMRPVPDTQTGVYGFQLWTVPIEFWASLIVFGVLVALVPAKRALRNACIALAAGFAVWCARWEIGLFLSGTLVADFDLCRARPAASLLPLRPERTPAVVLTSLLYTTVCAVGLYLGSTPEMNFASTPGFHALWAIHGREETWHAAGAVLVVWSISRAPLLQRPLVHPVTQYLGCISFSLYLVHVPILLWFGWAATPALWAVIGAETDFRFETGVVLGCLGVLGVVGWVADVFWRAVDAPSMRLGRRVERWAFGSGA